MKGSKAIAAGWQAVKRNELDLAEVQFQKAVDKGPDIAGTHIQQGIFLLQQDRLLDAISSFQKAASADPANPASFFFLSIAYEVNNDKEPSQQALADLLKICPRHQGIASLRLLASVRHGNPKKELLALGFGTSSHAPKESWRTLAAGIGVGNPEWLPSDLSSSPCLLGPIIVEIEKKLLPLEYPRLERRTSDLLKDLELLEQPKRELAKEFRSLPLSWKAAPKLSKGKNILDKAYEIVDLDEQHRQLDKAIDLLEAGLKLDPLAFRTNFHLGEAFLWNAKSTPGTPYRREMLLKAENHFIESVRVDGANPYIYLLLGLTSQLLGRPLSALQLYSKATEKFTKMPEAHYGMAQCYLLLEKPTEAKKYFLMAVNSDLALAKERLNLYATLNESNGPEFFDHGLPSLPPEAPSPEVDAIDPKNTPGSLQQDGSNQAESQSAPADSSSLNLASPAEPEVNIVNLENPSTDTSEV